MNKATRRRIVAKRLKELGHGKLYSGNKKVAWKLLRGEVLWRLHTALFYTKGQLVHDCDGLNHRIDKIDPIIYGNDFADIYSGVEHTFADGLRDCGCMRGVLDLPPTQEQIEKWITGYLEQHELDTAETGWPLNDCAKKRLAALRAGEHITDDDGVLLPEYSER